MTPQSSAERCRDDRISRYSPRALAPILRAAMPKNKYVKASELIMKVEALAVVPVTEYSTPLVPLSAGGIRGSGVVIRGNCE